MTALVPNIALGRVVEFGLRIDGNDPANSAFVVMVLVSTATDATLKDYDTFAEILNDADTAEATNTGYARKIITSVTIGLDDRLDARSVGVADQTWSAVLAGDDWTHLVVGYDPDTTSGDDTAIVPVHIESFAFSPNGSDVTWEVADGGFYRAS